MSSQLKQSLKILKVLENRLVKYGKSENNRSVKFKTDLDTLKSQFVNTFITSSLSQATYGELLNSFERIYQDLLEDHDNQQLPQLIQIYITRIENLKRMCETTLN